MRHSRSVRVRLVLPAGIALLAALGVSPVHRGLPTAAAQTPTAFAPGVTFGLGALDVNPRTSLVQVVTVADYDFSALMQPACPGLGSYGVSCSRTADGALPAPPPGPGPDACGAIWRDLNVIYVARAGQPWVDMYSTSTVAGRYIYLGAFGINGMARSITLQRGTGYLVAALATTPASVEVYNPPSSVPVYSWSCPQTIQSYDYVTSNCDGDIAALVTGTNQKLYVARKLWGCPPELIELVPPESDVSYRNEYLVPDVRKNIWAVTSQTVGRLQGTLYKIASDNTVTVFPGKGGRYVCPDLPYTDGGGCSDPLPHIFVVQQIDPVRGRLMKINQSGTVVASVTYAPRPGTPDSPCSSPGRDPNYGEYDMSRPINVDTGAPDSGIPATQPRGRVWVALSVCGNRVFDCFTRDLCPRSGCGLGGVSCFTCGSGGSSNMPFCELINPGCPGSCLPLPPLPHPCSSSPPIYPCTANACTAYNDPQQPYRTPTVKGNGSPDWNLLTSPCCDVGTIPSSPPPSRPRTP